MSLARWVVRRVRWRPGCARGCAWQWRVPPGYPPVPVRKVNVRRAPERGGCGVGGAGRRVARCGVCGVPINSTNSFRLSVPLPLFLT